MGDPTNRNDPEFAGNPRYVWSGGRYQYVGDPSTASQPSQGGSVKAESLGTPGGMGQVFTGLFDRIGGSPFGQASDAPPGGTSPNTSIPNAQHWLDLARANATRQTATSPYNAGIANQSRGAQQALFAQMQAQQAGPSVAALQGQRALGQNLQGALSAGAGRGAMQQMSGNGAGIAGSIGQARLAEQMRGSAGMGGLAGGLRGNDQSSALAQARSGLDAQRIADDKSKFYSSLGSTASNAVANNKLDDYSRNEELKNKGRAANEKAIMDYINFMKNIVAGGA